MSNVVKKTISLTTEQAAFIDAQVASGQFTNASEVIRESLRHQQRREVALERFIRNEGVKAYDAYMANPEAALPADKAFAELDKRIAEFEAGKS